MALVLVIEDDKPVLENLVNLLELEGFDVIEAENGSAGVQLASSQIPDLILCDILMPGLDGYEVLRTLRTSPTTATIPLMFLTCLAKAEYWRQGIEWGAEDYLTKPYTREVLISAIKVQLQKQLKIQYQEQSTKQAKKGLLKEALTLGESMLIIGGSWGLLLGLLFGFKTGLIAGLILAGLLLIVGIIDLYRDKEKIT
jgi:CheY-like chemotaxis protein